MSSVSFVQSERLIALPQAAAETEIPLNRLRSWRRKGRLVPVARMRGDAPNGGVLLFKLEDVLHLRDDPPPRGRPPRQRGAHPLRSHREGA